MTRRTRRALAGVAALPILFVTVTACFAEVDGERAASGECPPGERCSDSTPSGLTFVGAILYDDASTLRLGPVLVGGRFDLGFYARGMGPRLEAAAVEIEDPSILRGNLGTGTFGPLDEESGEPIHAVDGFAVLRGRAQGDTYVRIVDPATGELHDRLRLEVLKVEDVHLRNVGDPERVVLYAGESELLGVRVVAGEGEVRTIDQSLALRAEGQVQPERMYWDCFSYVVPTDRDEVRFEIVAGGRTFERTIPIERRPEPESP